ncbi:hypothetical protein NDU88_003157 [Pleurodeles waltl]|uniref:Uncharacterized protein n=1 Tax=Pleurodeles waltl TaxID=8319 RepID=A0AAV7NFT1_PLEWA|nr:hypothetical protein NDU88_003157 [Pleurodeles waltl]
MHQNPARSLTGAGDCRETVCCLRSGHARKRSPEDQACSKTTWSGLDLKWRQGVADGAHGRQLGWDICDPSVQERRATPHPLPQESRGLRVDKATRGWQAVSRRWEGKGSEEQQRVVAGRGAEAVPRAPGVCRLDRARRARQAQKTRERLLGLPGPPLKCSWGLREQWGAQPPHLQPDWRGARQQERRPEWLQVTYIEWRGRRTVGFAVDSPWPS